MPSNLNKLKANKLKEEAAPAKKNLVKERKKAGEKRKKTSSGGLDPRLVRILGFFLILSSFYLFLAFTSFFINWFKSNPDSFLNGSLGSYFIDHAQMVKNWTGKLGSFVSQYLVSNGVGFGAYLFALGLFAWGFWMLFKVRLFKLWRWFQLITLCFLWLPMFLNLIMSAHPENVMGGLVGSQLNIWLLSYLGNVGLVFLLIFVPAIFILIDFRFAIFNSIFRKKEAEGEVRNHGGTPEGDLYNTVEFSLSEVDELSHEEENKEITGEEDFNIEVDRSLINKKKETTPIPAEEDLELTIEQAVEEKKVQKVNQGDHHGIDTEYDPTLDLADFKLPGINLLDEYDDGNIKVDKEELEANKNKIVETLNHYAIGITKIKATIGPTVTLYEIVPAPGIRISRIKNLEDDIALSLAAMGIRIIAPIPGKGTVGIEVPNRKPTIVSMRSILESDKFQNNNYELPFALGKTIANESFVADLTKMPHILMAGATGQGKSVGLNAIIASLLYKKHPAELKFIMVDPKKVELTLFSRIERHYLAKLPDSEEAIITDTRKVVRTLNSLSIEMDNRYELLKDAQVRNIKEYNVKFKARKLSPVHGHRFLPYLVLVIDEFADLIMTAGKEIESPITRLAQLARAVGIHLIIATQRPSVNIITGTIKANFPARVAFRVISKIDSRTILDTGGADQLIGRGDMLLSTGSDLIRLQCAFIDTHEVERVTDYIGTQRAYPDALHLPEYYDEEPNSKNDFDPNERDEFFEDAAQIIVQTQQGSTSLLQRKLKLGYNRAGRIIDQLEAAGIVGPFEGSKAREVKVANEMALEQFLKDLNLSDQEK